MSQTKKVTLSALMVALGAATMMLGTVIDVLDLSVCAIASLLVVFIYLEIGSYFPWLVWICTSLSILLMNPGSLVWAEYLLVFGIYPLMKAYIERLPRWSWLIVKILYINAIVWSLFFICEGLLGLPFFDEDSLVMKVALYVLINVAFVVYDFFITVMVRFYLQKLRPRFRKFLK